MNLQATISFQALGIHEPKLVIRLVPCQKGRTYWEGRPAIRNILPTKARFRVSRENFI